MVALPRRASRTVAAELDNKHLAYGLLVSSRFHQAERDVIRTASFTPMGLPNLGDRPRLSLQPWIALRGDGTGQLRFTRVKGLDHAITATMRAQNVWMVVRELD